MDDTYRELNDLYSLRVDLVKLMCAFVPTRDGTFPTEEELETHPWYQAFSEREADIRGAAGVDRRSRRARPRGGPRLMSGNPDQEAAALAIRAFINRFPTGSWPAGGLVLTGDVLGIVSRHDGRVEEAQTYLASSVRATSSGAEQAPRLYTAGYGEEGTEIPVGVLVAAGTDESSVNDLAGWLSDLHDAVDAWNLGSAAPPLSRSRHPYPLLRQILQISAARGSKAREATALRDGLARLRDLVE